MYRQKDQSHRTLSPNHDRPFDLRKRQCQDASCKDGMRLQTVNTSLSLGAVYASAARSGLWRRTTDAQLVLQCHFLFAGCVRNQLYSVYGSLSKRATGEGRGSEHQRSQIVLQPERKLRKKFQSTNLAILAEVCPHAGAIPSSHQHMVDEEVCTRYAADEFARNAIIVVA